MEKKDVVILASERGYRLGYLKQVLAGTPVEVWDHMPLTKVEVERLIDKYVEHGFVGDRAILRDRNTFAKKISSDPIAVAWCRIMNDFCPLDRIVADVIADAKEPELDRYLCAAVAQHCFMGGIRYEVLIGAMNATGVKGQFEKLATGLF